MISSQNRFHGRKSIAGMYTHGSVIRAKELQLRYKPKRPNSKFKVAIVVSKKTAKLAVVRNRIRRRIYEWVRLNLPADYNYDIMLTIFEANLSTIPSEQINKLLETTFAKIKPQHPIDKTS